MKDSVTPEAVRADLDVLSVGSLALLAIGVLLLWRSIPVRPAHWAPDYRRQ